MLHHPKMNALKKKVGNNVHLLKIEHPIGASPYHLISSTPARLWIIWGVSLMLQDNRFDGGGSILSAVGSQRVSLNHCKISKH